MEMIELSDEGDGHFGHNVLLCGSINSSSHLKTMLRFFLFFFFFDKSADKRKYE